MENDKQLMERCRNNDSSAFEELFGRYGRRIYALIYQMTTDRHQAEDIMQEAFLRAYEYIASHRKITNFYPWLCRVAINLVVDYHRSSHSRNTVELGEEEMEFLTDPMENNPQSDMENKELGQQINAALETLPNRQRQVFALKNVAGLSHREIAVALNCSQDTVRANLYQAVKKLRGKLRKYLAQEVNIRNEV
jgi:RNA polymerase sigma-70 factor, ECF subfamily